MALGFLLLALGYSLSSLSHSFAGALVFLASYALGYADYRFRKRSKDKAAAFHVGIAVAPVAAGYFHFFMLLIGLAGAAIAAWKSHIDQALALRLLHFWVVSLSFSILLMVTKIARRPAPRARE